MDSNCSYEIVLGISLFLFLVICIIICIDLSFDGIRNMKFLPTKSVSALFFLGIVAYCCIEINTSYKEVYYLEYTVYYPGNTCKFKVDSCNHIYASSDRGTNHIRYYSIPKKDTYGTDTTAPIVIDKIIKK